MNWLRRLTAGSLAAILLLGGCTQTGERVPPKFTYPTTRTEAIAEEHFGVQVSDPYRWLEDETSTEVKAWMAAQDKLTRQTLHAIPQREALIKRLKELYYVDSIRLPRRCGERLFYTKKDATQEKAILYWRDGVQGEEHVLLDPSVMGAAGNVSLGSWEPSRDGKTIAYALKPNNADEATIYVKDVTTDALSAVDVIEGAKFAEPIWTPQGDGFYYTYHPSDASIPEEVRAGHADIRFHKLGTPQREDVVIHEKTGDPKKYLDPDLSRDGRWLFVYISSGWDAVDIFYRDLTTEEKAFKPFVTGLDALTTVTPWKGHFYILTDHDTPSGTVYRTSCDKPTRAHWETVVAERKDVIIEGMQVLGGHLVLEVLKNASRTIEIRTLAGELVRTIAVPGGGTAIGVYSITGNPEDDAAYFSFASFTVATEIYRTSIAEGTSSLWARVKVPIDGDALAVEQVWYPSKDGTRVSMFIVRRTDTPRDGSTPFLLNGYGGFNITMTPRFRSSIFPWLEAGGGYAVPNLRGGGEYGQTWHRAGMLTKKQNVFDDFIYAAKYLISENYTRPDRLAILGGSNGGLLVGAAMTQAPELFGAVICAVPLLDMVRYHLFGLGKLWIPEYGSAENQEQFNALYAYSPYHRVQPDTAYPATLFLSADSDDRVDPMHARKMAAALQAVSGEGRPILLRIETAAGHGGADMVKKTVESSADMYSFLMQELGVGRSSN